MRSGGGKTTSDWSAERAAAGAGHAVGVTAARKRRDGLVAEFFICKKLCILLKIPTICKKFELFVKNFIYLLKILTK